MALNQLINEKSPYLLQHADNPVHWYPWGEEAFLKAKTENKPIFLSIGYSTCHWCHVMAHESFEDEEVAALLNKYYISIKVDREERPDVDSIYMKVCQMMTGHGGWPLTIVMTPDKIPFYAGTYFPRERKHGLPGIMEVLTQLHHSYVENPKRITKITEQVQQALAQTVQEKSGKRLSIETADLAFQQLKKQFDLTHGGFGSAPKFPQPQNLLFLLRYAHFTENKTALQMVERTLEKMAAGGIYDQVGFGFSRYATDEKWLIPHFEKMLYDNALLLMVYTEAYQITKKTDYQKIAEQIVAFVMREMTDQKGAFYSAIDADSEGVEGKYYVWKDEEIFDILGEELGQLYADAFNITPFGNFEGANIPNQIGISMEKVAQQHGLTVDALNEKLTFARRQLLQAREKRVYPHVDDKILTAWNGLMIAALANAGKVFNESSYTKAVENALHFVEQNLFLDERLFTRYRDGETKHKAYLDDYAFLAWGYIELYNATYTPCYLAKGKDLLYSMIDLFWDKDNGGFFFTGKDGESLIAKDKEVYDGALPSGNSVAAVILVRMAHLTGISTFLECVDEMYDTFYADLHLNPSASAFFMQTILLTESASKEIILLGKKTDPNRIKFFRDFHQTFLPEASILAAESITELENIAPFTVNYPELNDQTTIYICENFACQAPTTDVNKAIGQLIRNNEMK
ncbi:thioredoxin domain-containing protein [Virgibacillus sp. MG-45]|uniref:thioredoxin domain-containing protein n=1 Tax=Virgibacillus sp. MG-45 TaxID=3102791 RepID=UPI002EDA688A